MKNTSKKELHDLHEHVPSNWYYQSLKIDPLQRYWHNRRFEEVGEVLEKTDGEILDIGCADGVFSKVILNGTSAKKLIGIDFIKGSVEWASNHWKKDKKLNFRIGDAQKLNFKSGSFSAVFAIEVLEHVYDPVKVLKEIKRLLKKNGYALFLVPSDSLLFRIVWFLWLNFYPRGWVWKDAHVQTYRDNLLPAMCREAGFKIEID